MPKIIIDHAKQVRAVNALACPHHARAKPCSICGDSRGSEYGAWHRRMYDAIHKAHPYPVQSSIRFFKDKLGRQNTCVVFRHRNWVWTDPEAGWTLYADVRGPALHVHQDLTPEKAWEAVCAFAERIGVPMANDR